MHPIFQKAFVVLLTISVSVFCRPVYPVDSESDETDTTEIKEGEGEKESEIKSKGKYDKTHFDGNDLGFVDSVTYKSSLSFYFIKQGKARICRPDPNTPFYLLYHNLKLDC